MSKVNNLIGKVVKKAVEFKNDERGSLSEMTWVIGSAVVVVLIIIAFMTLAPTTAQNLWNSFVNYAEGALGL